jgi:hypothetical protein
MQQVYERSQQDRSILELIEHAQENCKMVSNQLFFSVLYAFIKNLTFPSKLDTIKFLDKTARDWITEEEKRGNTSTEDQLADHQSTPRRPKKDPPGRLSGDFSMHK